MKMPSFIRSDDELTPMQKQHAIQLFKQQIEIQNQKIACFKGEGEKKSALSQINMFTQKFEAPNNITFLRGIINGEIYTKYYIEQVPRADMHRILHFVDPNLQGLRAFSKFSNLKELSFAYNQEICIKIILNTTIYPSNSTLVKRYQQTYPKTNRVLHIKFDNYDHHLLIERTKNKNKLIAAIPLSIQPLYVPPLQAGNGMQPLVDEDGYDLPVITSQAPLSTSSTNSQITEIEHFNFATFPFGENTGNDFSIQFDNDSADGNNQTLENEQYSNETQQQDEEEIFDSNESPISWY